MVSYVIGQSISQTVLGSISVSRTLLPGSALRPPPHRHRLLSGSLPLVRLGQQVNCSGGMSGLEWIEVIMVVGNCQMLMVIVGN